MFSGVAMPFSPGFGLGSVDPEDRSTDPDSPTLPDRDQRERHRARIKDTDGPKSLEVTIESDKAGHAGHKERQELKDQVALLHSKMDRLLVMEKMEIRLISKMEKLLETQFTHHHHHLLSHLHTHLHEAHLSGSFPTQTSEDHPSKSLSQESFASRSLSRAQSQLMKSAHNPLGLSSTSSLSALEEVNEEPSSPIHPGLSYKRSASRIIFDAPELKLKMRESLCIESVLSGGHSTSNNSHGVSPSNFSRFGNKTKLPMDPVRAAVTTHDHLYVDRHLSFIRKLTRKFRNYFPLLPDSSLVLAFDVVGISLLLQDAVLVPYMLAWGQGMTGYFFYMAWVSAMCWTTDLLLHFFTGYPAEDRVVRSYRKIAKRYLKRWFIIDFIVVIVDWVAIFVEASATAPDGSEANNRNKNAWTKLVRCLKVGRIIRIYSMVQAGKAAQLIEFIMQRANAMGIAMVLQFVGTLSKLVLIILWLNHVGACLWITVENNQSSDTGASWAKTVANMHNGNDVEDAGLSDAYVYLIAYYWAITTMFSGASFLAPMTTLESVFACSYVLFGILLASSMFSFMAAMLMDSHHRNREKWAKFSKLQNFLQQQGVNRVLSLMIQRQARERMTVERRLVQTDVSVIMLLSAELRGQLKYSLWSPVLRRHPLWRTCEYVDEKVLKSLCKTGIGCVTLEPGEILFEPGDILEQTYFQVWGKLRYTLEMRDRGNDEDMVRRSDEEDMVGSFINFVEKRNGSGRSGNFQRSGSAPISEPSVSSVDSGFSRQVTPVTEIDMTHITQFAEIALWVDWSALGFVEAMGHTELLVCTVHGFVDAYKAMNRYVQSLISGYGAAVVESYREVSASTWTDLESQMEFEAILGLMPDESRIFMNMPCLQQLRKKLYRTSMTPESLEQLELEIMNGKCNLSMDGTGRVQRVVQVVALQLWRPDGMICVQLGESSNEKAPQEDLPGRQSSRLSQISVHSYHKAQKLQIALPGTKTYMQETPTAAVRRLVSRFPDLASAIIISDDYLGPEHQETQSATFGIPTKYSRYMFEARLDISHDMGLTKLPFEQGHVEGFTLKENREDADERVLVMAFMTQCQFSRLTAHTAQHEATVRQWLETISREDATIIPLHPHLRTSAQSTEEHKADHHAEHSALHHADQHAEHHAMVQINTQPTQVFLDL